MALTLYVVVYPSGNTAPTNDAAGIAKIKAGQDGGGATATWAAGSGGGVSWTGAGQQVTASGLSSGGYKASAVVSDGVTDSNVVTSSIWYALAGGTGTFTFTGNAAGLAKGSKFAAATGAFTLTGNAAGLKRGYTLTAAAGSFALTGNAAGLRRDYTLAAGAGSFTLTGNDATLTYTPAAGSYTLTAQTGSFALTGNAAGLAAQRKMAAAAGSFTLTGNDAAFTYGRTLAAVTGTFTLTGNDAGLTSTGSTSYSTGAVLYLSPRLTTGLFTATGVQSATDLASWLPPAGQPIGFLMLQGQKVPVMIDPAWYKFLHFVGEVKLGGITTASVPDVISAVETTQTTSATVAATVAAVEQMGTTNAAALSAVVQVSKVNALEGSDQIPLVQSQVG